MALTGALIAESLRIGAVLDDLELTIRKISRADVGDVDAGQPLTWSFLEFEAADEEAPRLMSKLSEALDPTVGWYCDFRSGRDLRGVRWSRLSLPARRPRRTLGSVRVRSLGRRPRRSTRLAGVGAEIRRNSSEKVAGSRS
jgi:hypothetical protein